MPIGKLTVAKVRKLDQPGRYSDGGCLYLVVAPGGSKHWVARLTINGRQTDMGLGGASVVTLEEARTEAARLRKIARSGGDPRQERRKEALTFEEATRRVHQSLLPTFRNQRHGQIWLRSMENHVFPQLGQRQLETIGTADLLEVLTPIWTEKHDTARRIKQRIASVFDWAKAAGHYTKENPVTSIKRALPKVRHQAKHMAALPWRDMPAFMEELAARDAISAKCLRFAVLTGLRSKETRGARWSEIKDGIWTVPASRMKAGHEHKVPLSEAALALLDEVRGLDPVLLFPSPMTVGTGSAKMLSVNAFRPLYERMGYKGVITTHGFRSTLRDWSSEYLRIEREVAEAVLAHKVGDRTEQAYARSTLLERRRELMEAWGRFCSGETAEVIQIVRS